ncbi:hypothetical protein [Lacinutrix neustonica]|uniref:hypothetical protein n=1 Tax=Lacinutrix neustonica TaxID=2980107 RepID=UPI0028BE9DDD|nr:hypothetical protein [Lacinutrix neustonica]
MNPDDFSSFLMAITHQDIQVIDAIIPKSSYIPIRLSESNSDLETFDIGSSEAWEVYITNYLKTHHKKVAFGGYLEKRGIYNRSDYFNNQNP